MASNKFIYVILGAFFASALLLIVLQYNSRLGIRALIDGNERLMAELRAGNALRQAERDILSTESRIRAAAATGDTSYLAGTDELVAEAEANLDTLRRTFGGDGAAGVGGAGADGDRTATDGDSVRAYLDRLALLGAAKARWRDDVLVTLRRQGRVSLTANRDSNQVDALTGNIYRSREQRLARLEAGIRADGKRVQRLETLLVAVGLLSGALFFWFIINRIRYQNRSIRRLDASEKKVQETARIKENFLANMSHEIRTPLNAILGFTYLLKNRNTDPAQAEFIRTIEQSGENLLAIVGDILDISKIEAGMIRIESAPFGLRDLLQSVVVLFRARAEEKGIALEPDTDPSLPDVYVGDAMRLTQILVNLVGNAVKFTEKGSITLRVSGARGDGDGARSDGTALTFTVSDTGIGIPPEHLSAVFDRFTQADASITRRFGGTGLGLSIVRDLVELQGGHITVDSQPGRGTTFTFTIGYALPSGPVSGVVKEAPAARLEGIRLLVVEDNAMNQSLLRHVLTDWKLSFDLVGSGEQALEALVEKTYTLILMDIQMPGLDGYATTRQIRERLHLRLPVIAMTAHAMAGEREKCVAAGMDGYITKPLDVAELYRLILRFSDAPVYSYIDLRYMKQVSNGNKAYEKSVTRQFIEGVPRDLDTLEQAYSAGDIALLKRTAHDMRNSLGVMGLAGRLQDVLDGLEYGPAGSPTGAAEYGPATAARIEALRAVCLPAVQEARHFYETL
ncbi:hybrid sensor histidine kinase/response regulator [Dinghuibacter silviterrae]|uniref:histidine kinase n=1 Tax=Dinghuibacter silviterrae TaxID=1539049 RepID=A0A4R8DSN7_9BACT|nr:hybrid sensor histidine kinase/response regulator [Dinghuibacter silviterrae]TDX00886.1 signal transduction histidine kinase [Dinghuibacter silviterrae]